MIGYGIFTLLYRGFGRKQICEKRRLKCSEIFASFGFQTLKNWFKKHFEQHWVNTDLAALSSGITGKWQEILFASAFGHTFASVNSCVIYKFQFFYKMFRNAA